MLRSRKALLVLAVLLGLGSAVFLASAPSRWERYDRDQRSYERNLARIRELGERSRTGPLAESERNELERASMEVRIDGPFLDGAKWDFYGGLGLGLLLLAAAAGALVYRSRLAGGPGR